MADPFLGEIRLFAFGIVPQGWAVCDGRQLQINQNNALYSLLSTYFGGDGKTYFNIPDLRGRVPVHNTLDGNPDTKQGVTAGIEGVTLTSKNVPLHTHTFVVQNKTATVGTPAGNLLAKGQAGANTLPFYSPYTSGMSTKTMDVSMIGGTGGNGAHENRQPSLVLNYCIALTGIYPPRS